MALRTINYAVTVSEISPKSPQYGGIQGERNATDVIFTLDSALVTALTAEKTALETETSEIYSLAYRVNMYDGSGGYYPSESLTPIDNKITYSLESTSVSGTYQLYLIISLIDSDNMEKVILYSYPATIKIDAAAQGTEQAYEAKQQISGAVAEALAEADRATAQANRATAQANLTGAEAELARKQSETERIASEIQRIASESSRISAETERISNESSRISAEDIRLSSESDRISAELTREQKMIYASSLPIGAILPFGGATAPAGTLFADGSAVLRTTYSNLFATIGTAYGAGDGSTTFNLPDMRYRVPVGQDITQTEFDTLGKTGGEKTHTLTVAEMATHVHDLGIVNPNLTAETGYRPPWSSDGSFTVSQNTGESGGDVPHNNLQPYLVTNYIIVYAGGVSQAQIDASLQGAKDYADSQDVINLASAKSYTNSSVALKQDKTITDTGDYFTATTVDNVLQEVGASLVDSDAHIADTANPHNVTKAQVGLGNVDNTADADKQVSTAQQIAIDNAITTSGTNADDKITAHNTSAIAHEDKFAQVVAAAIAKAQEIIDDVTEVNGGGFVWVE